MNMSDVYVDFNGIGVLGYCIAITQRINLCKKQTTDIKHK